MFREIRSYTLPLTREYAEEVATMPKWKGERDLRASRLEFLNARHKDGTFHSPGWAFAWLGGKRIRVNGQHSSTMLAALNGDFPVGMMVHVREFACDTEQDLADLFNQFDNAGSVRTKKEQIGAHGCIHTEYEGIAKRRLSAATAGIAAFLGSFGDGRRLATEDQVRLLHSHKEFILWVAPFVGHKLLERMPVVAAIFATWQVSPIAAGEFWTLVNDESHPDVNNPTRFMHRLLNERYLLGSTAKRNDNRKREWDDRAIYAKSIHAWNAWRRNTKTDGKYYADSPLPKPI